MFVKVIANGVTQYISRTKTEMIASLKSAYDFAIELDDNGDFKIYSDDEVKAILCPTKEVQADLAEALGMKKTTKKSTK